MALLDRAGNVVPLPKPGKRKKVYKRPSGPSEKSIQATVEQYLNVHNIRFIHIPNLVYRLCSPHNPLPLHQKREISRYLKGIPDLVILHDDKVLLIELKRKNGKPRQPQKAWLKGLTHHICDTASDAIMTINHWRNECL